MQGDDIGSWRYGVYNELRLSAGTLERLPFERIRGANSHPERYVAKTPYIRFSTHDLGRRPVGIAPFSLPPLATVAAEPQAAHH